MWVLLLLLFLFLSFLLPIPIDDPKHKKERWYNKY